MFSKSNVGTTAELGNVDLSGLRIFHGMYNIASIPGTISHYENQAGATSHCYSLNSLPDFGVSHFTQNLSDLDQNSIVDWYDIFNIHFGVSMSGLNMQDVYKMANKGKKIFFHFHGCDVRDAKYVMSNYRYSACAECFPQQCSPNRLLSLDLAGSISNGNFVSTPDIMEFVPKSIWLPQIFHAFDKPKVVKRRKFSKRYPLRILHAPSSTGLKGTKYIQTSIEEMTNKGWPIVLDTLSGVSREGVLAAIKKADVVIDQMLFGSYGTFAVEAMSMGVPTICYIRDNVLESYPDDLPLIFSDISRLEKTISDIVLGRLSLESFSRASSHYAQKHHSPSRVLGILSPWYTAR